MKGIKLEIPIYAILILIASILGFNWLKNQKINALEEEVNTNALKVDSTLLATSEIQRKLIDTIAFYEEVISIKNEELEVLELEAFQYEKKISSIKEEIQDYSFDTLYLITQGYLPWKTDSNKYQYSGNQVEEIYFEHLQLKESIKGIVSLRKYSKELESGLSLRDKQINNYAQLDSSRMQEITILSESNSEKDKTIKSQAVKNKKLRITVPFTGLLGIILGALLL